MRLHLKLLLLPILISQLVFPVPLVRAEPKPMVAVPPFGHSGNEEARKAVIQNLQKSGRVQLVERKATDKYLDDLNSRKRSKKDPSDSEAAKLLAEGQDAYKNLNIKEAISLLGKAKLAYRNDLSNAESFEGLRAAQFHLAVAHQANKDITRAREELKEVVVLDPERHERKLSSKLYSPAIMNLYKEAQEEIHKREHGDLEVLTQPSGAVAYIDGKSIGATPARLRELPAGEHFIRIELDGFESHVAPKFVVAGENRLDVTLSVVRTLDISKSFETVTGADQIDPQRAAFLDEMGLALGADIFLLVTPESGAVSAQFYDQRSQDVSPIARDMSPEGLAQKLLKFLDPSGYVISIADAPKPTLAKSKRSFQPQVDSKTGNTLSGQIDQPLLAPNRPGEKKEWFENIYLWAAIGGGLLLVGGSVLLFTDVAKDSANTSTLTLEVPGR